MKASVALMGYECGNSERVKLSSCLSEQVSAHLPQVTHYKGCIHNCEEQSAAVEGGLDLCKEVVIGGKWAKTTLVTESLFPTIELFIVTRDCD